jgi:hypothetical protein
VAGPVGSASPSTRPDVRGLKSRHLSVRSRARHFQYFPAKYEMKWATRSLEQPSCGRSP